MRGGGQESINTPAGVMVEALVNALTDTLAEEKTETLFDTQRSLADKKADAIANILLKRYMRST